MNHFITDIVRFFAMGGYARYIWPAYSLAFFLLFFNIYWPLRQYHNLIKKISATNSRAEA